jgi:molybdenum cofactor synthesis domain-containing protein
LSCTVEILSIGNELLLGNTVNTNASWIASQITSLGGSVTRITTVGDNLREISQVIIEALKRKPSILVTTGGIGPTFDDMTLKGVARALHLRLKMNRTAVEMVREHYARRFPMRRIALTKPRIKMAVIPAGAAPITNPVGTAPGVELTASSTKIFCLPGVPSEAKAIFRNYVSKMIVEKTGGKVFTEKWLKVRGVMESSLAPVIDRVMGDWPGVYIKSHPRGVEASGRPFIELHFSISSSNQTRAEQTLLNAISELIRQLRDFKPKIGGIR